MANEYVEVTLIIAPNGDMSAGIPSGIAPERAVPALERFFKYMKVDRMPVEIIGQVEQHAHPPKGVRVSFGSRAHQH